MLDVRTAIALVQKKYPNKRMRGDPGEWNGKFVFQFVDKTANEEEARWDASVFAVDKETGSIEVFNAFTNYDFLDNTKLIHEY